MSAITTMANPMAIRDRPPFRRDFLLSLDALIPSFIAVSVVGSYLATYHFATKSIEKGKAAPPRSV